MQIKLVSHSLTLVAGNPVKSFCCCLCVKFAISLSSHTYIKSKINLVPICSLYQFNHVLDFMLGQTRHRSIAGPNQASKTNSHSCTHLLVHFLRMKQTVVLPTANVLPISLMDWFSFFQFWMKSLIFFVSSSSCILWIHRNTFQITNATLCK